MLAHYKTILVATDLSPNSEEAFKHAVMLARHHDAKIHLLHVVAEIDSSVRAYVSTLLGKGQLDQFEQGHENKAFQEIKGEIDNFAREELGDFPEDLKRFAGTDVVHGNPVFQILKTADLLDADVIVMGSHGKGALEYSFLGSVAEKVLRKCHRPVFIVPLPPKS